jgi:hypothetical protein
MVLNVPFILNLAFLSIFSLEAHVRRMDGWMMDRRMRCVYMCTWTVIGACISCALFPASHRFIRLDGL